MKNQRAVNQFRCVVCAVGIVTIQAVGWAGAAEAQVLPAKPDLTCQVSPAEFSSWFKPHPAGPDQPVQAADSINLDIDAKKPNCVFYKWSAQMFLWLTSPAAGLYPGKPAIDPKFVGRLVPRVFGSPVFYQVKNDQLQPQANFGPRNLVLRATKFGLDGLPVIIDSKGHLREFVTAPRKSGISTLEVLGGGSAAQIETVRRGEGGKAEFLDASGKAVTFVPKVTAAMLPQTLGRLASLAPVSASATAQDASVRQRIAEVLTARKILIQVATKRGAAFVEAGTGIVDDLGPGQAGSSGVLFSQQNSLIFYEILVNDVYAWYLTGRKTANGILPPYSATSYGHFPTTKKDLDTIIAFSRTHGGPASFPDEQALAVEVKLAWVDASTLPNRAQGYITAPAVLPTYDTSNPMDWSPNGSKPAIVALVGAHIVGSVKGHPEMVWSTFEHQANSPLAQYTYTSGGQTVTVAQNTAGTWLFSASGASGTFNTQLATYCSKDEQKSTPCTLQHIFVAPPSKSPIGRSNVLREESWGVSADATPPNQEDATPAAANTEVISLNTEVRARLDAVGAGADPRFNYLFIGSTWTLGGAPPTGAYAQKGNEIGTNTLANSTMETFVQGSNCFDCHGDLAAKPPAQADTSVSHIFSHIAALPLLAQTRDK